MTAFWRNWLTIWCWGIVVFGAVLATAGFAATDAPARAAFALIGGGVDLSVVWDHPAQRFANGLMGAVTLGWGLTVLAFVRANPSAGAAWRALTGSLVAWYVIDSTISVANGFPLNAVSNTLVLALFLIPVAKAGLLKG